MTEDVRIIMRPFDQLKDEAMIYATWRNSSFYSAKNRTEILNQKAFFSAQTANIKKILPHASIKIACLSDDPDTIIGYSVSTGDHLDWIFVKADFRKMGIGTMLYPKDTKTVTHHLTKVGDAIVIKKNLKTKGD